MKKRILTFLSVLMLAFVLGTISGGIQVSAAGYASTITLCGINNDTTSITVNADTAVLPKSDDGMFYLFAEPTFSGGLTTAYLAATPMATSVSFTADLKKAQSDSRLYSKFIVAVLSGGQYVAVSEAKYLTNPEAVATSTTARVVPGSKKGLMIDPAKLGTGELEDLGVKQTAYNINVSYILGPTSNSAYPTIDYTYNGKNYQFNGLRIAEYDGIFKALSSKGISITAILLNNYDPSYLQLIHPLARDGFVCSYYMFNAADQSGVELMAAVGSFLSQRYSNKGVGQVDNWIIGNEITARTQWNYISAMKLDAYVEEYAKAFRVFYTAIKSENANANIYLSIDQQWDRNRKQTENYDGRDLLTSFNANISSKGNIDWGVACHPYGVPLTWAKFWDVPANYAKMKLVSHSVSSKFLTMQNIEVLTDFLVAPAMISSTGQVRSVICTEVGYTDAQGQDIQAVAFTYGYLQAAYNQYIDAFIISSETDHEAEIAQGLAMGLTKTDGSHKLIYDFYKYIDTPNSTYYTELAKPYVGITDWTQVLTAR